MFGHKRNLHKTQQRRDFVIAASQVLLALLGVLFSLVVILGVFAVIKTLFGPRSFFWSPGVLVEAGMYLLIAIAAVYVAAWVYKNFSNWLDQRAVNNNWTIG